MTDPFRARPKGGAQPAPQAPAPAAPSGGEPSRAELEDMRKADLVALAESRGLDTDGTKADLIDRLLA